MKLLTGYLLADHALKKSSCYREVQAGEVIFTEGSVASGLFIVLSGTIEIVKNTAAGEVKLTEVGPDGIFGEMGLVSEGGVRAATARAAEPSMLLEVRHNPIEMLTNMGEVHAALGLLKQVICVLSEWLRSQNERADRITDTQVPAPSTDNPGEAGARGVILPKSFLKLFPKQVQLADGEYLCREGETSLGFYFIHRGSLEILKADAAGGGEHRIGTMKSPTVAGEIGYFSNQPRLVSLRAAGPVAFTFFSGYDYEILVENSPEKAFNVLLVAAQGVVALVDKGNI